jgi:hypothetical protein
MDCVACHPHIGENLGFVWTRADAGNGQGQLSRLCREGVGGALATVQQSHA